jgi:sigma-B regulation protein RsbU (phosphoserine phosphatase)
MLKFSSIKTRLIFYLIFGLLPIFSALLFLGESYTKNILYNKTILKAKMLSLSAARDIEDITFDISQKPKEIATLVGGNLSSLDEVQSLMKDEIRNNGYIYGMALALYPKYSQNKNFFCPYFYQRHNAVFRKDLTPPIYNYLKKEWFEKPIKLKKSLWSRPYFDKGGGEIWMSTYSSVIKDKQGKIIGVATADVSINFLSNIVNRIKILKSGGAFLFTDLGDVLAPLGNKQVMKSGIKEILSLYKKEDFKNMALKISNGNSRYASITANSKRYLIYYTPIRGTNWIIGITFPENELFLPMRKFETYFALIVLSGFFVIILLIVFISKRVTSDIEKIKAISMEIAKGNFDVEIPKNLSDESESVAGALDVMQKSLKKLIDDLKEKTRIENEIELARKIQGSFIPHELKKKIDGIEFSAFSEWAYRVGGDFYGISKVDKNRVIFYVGDVSGKGISAVLYAVVVKSMLDVLSEKPLSIDKIMNFLNNHLASAIKDTFATMFVGIIDTKNSKLQFCNAGHNPPVFSKNSAIFTPILAGNLPVGVFENADYKIQTMDLSSFDSILVYTDGITDAVNGNGEEFSEDRMLSVVKKCIKYNADAVKVLRDDLLIFVGREGLYDDTTLLYISKSD